MDAVRARVATDGPVAPVRRRPWPSPYLVVTAVAVLGAVALSVRQPWGADFGLHAAAVGRLRDDLRDPADPMVDAPGPSPYFTPYTMLLALVARVTGAPAAVVLSAAAPVNLALLLWGLRRFVGLFTASRWAPVLALAFAPLLWGPAVVRWSGFPALRGLVLTLPYPSTLALAVELIAWTTLAGAVASRRPWRWALSGLLGGLIVLTHPFTAVCAALGAIVLIVGGWRRSGRPGPAGPLVGVAVAAPVVLAWPYFRVADLLDSASELDAIHRMLYAAPVAQYGLGFLVGLPALAVRLRRDRLDPLVLLFAVAGAVVLAGAVGGGYALGRVWPVVLLSLHVAAAVELPRLVRRAAGRDRAAPTPGASRPHAPTAGVRVFAGLWVVAAVVATLVGFRAQYGNLLLVLPADQLTPARRQAHGVVNLPDYRWVGRVVDRGAVVLTGDEAAGRALLAYEIRAVAPPWPDPLLADEARRRADQAELLAPATGDPRRRALLDEYGVKWVLDTHNSYRWVNLYGLAIVDGPGPARLIRLRGSYR